MSYAASSKRRPGHSVSRPCVSKVALMFLPPECTSGGNPEKQAQWPPDSREVVQSTAVLGTGDAVETVSYTHLRAHETEADL
eukprot:4444346-Amphidinium_carterae.1